MVHKPYYVNYEPEVTTTYHLTITDSNGNTASASVLVTVVPTRQEPYSQCSFILHKMVNDNQPSVSAYMYKGKPPYFFQLAIAQWYGRATGQF